MCTRQVRCCPFSRTCMCRMLLGKHRAVPSPGVLASPVSTFITSSVFSQHAMCQGRMAFTFGQKLGLKFKPLAGQAAARAHHLGQGLRAHSRASPRHMPCKAGTTTVAPMRDAASLPGLPSFHGQGLAVAFAGAWGMPERRSSDDEDGWEAVRGAASPAAVMPRAPPEWQPPTDPSGPSAPPEFMPPREPGAMSGSCPV